MSRLATLLAPLVFSLLVGSQSALQAEEEQLKNQGTFVRDGNGFGLVAPKSTASVMLRITCEPDSGFDNPAAIFHIVSSSVVLRRAIEEVSPDIAQEEPLGKFARIYISSDVGNVSSRSLPTKVPGMLICFLWVDSFDERLPADKLLFRAFDELHGTLVSMGEVDQTKLAEQAQKLRAEEERVIAELRARRDQQERLAQTLGLTSSSAESIVRRQSQVESELLAASIELTGLAARRATLEKQISQSQASIQAELESDPVIEALQKAVELREKRAAAMREMLKPEARDERLQLDIELAEAQAELAQYRRTALREAGGDRLSELRQSFFETETKHAECAARIELLKKLASSPGNTGELRRINMQTELLEQKYRQILEQIHKLELQARFYKKPEVWMGGVM